MNHRELIERSFWLQVEQGEVPPEQWCKLALDCRGFLAEQGPHGAVVCGVNAARGRHSDLRLLRPPGRRGRPGRDGILFPTPRDERHARAMARHILRAGLPSLNGMTARDDFTPPGLRFKSDWHLFRKARWGPRIPTRVLEPGTALLVKTLPLLKVWTWLSCDGHGDGGEPFICARDHYHFAWLRGLMRCLAPPELQRHWRWEEGGSPGYHDWRWVLGPASEDPVVWAEMQARNIATARLLLDDDLLRRVEAARGQVKHPRELTNERIAELLSPG